MRDDSRERIDDPNAEQNERNGHEHDWESAGVIATAFGCIWRYECPGCGAKKERS